MSRSDACSTVHGFSSRSCILFLFLQQLRVHFVELVPTLPGISNQCKTGTRGAEPSPKSLAAVFCSLNILPFALLRQRRLRTALCVGRKCEAIYIAKPQYEACFIKGSIHCCFMFLHTSLLACGQGVINCGRGRVPLSVCDIGSSECGFATVASTVWDHKCED